MEECIMCRKELGTGKFCYDCQEYRYKHEFKECKDCIHRQKVSPCDSCEQPSPTNYTEEE